MAARSSIKTGAKHDTNAANDHLFTSDFLVFVPATVAFPSNPTQPLISNPSCQATRREAAKIESKMEAKEEADELQVQQQRSRVGSGRAPAVKAFATAEILHQLW